MTVVENRENKKGFTLIELAVVIVIMGIIVAGVMQGQELIKQANIRAQIKQIEEFDRATAIFKTKYDALPGDIVNPTRFGFFNGAYNASIASLLGNGIINDENGNYSSVNSNIEPTLYFIHLNQSKLINSLMTFSNSWGHSCYWNGNYSKTVGCQFPEGKIGKGGFAAYTGVDGALYYFFGISNYDPLVSNPYLFLSISQTPVLPPTYSFILDNKIDDGIPSTGNVRAVRLTSNNATTFSNDITLNSCLGSSNQIYNIADERLLCRLSIKSINN